MQIDRHTDMTENVTYLHTRVVKIGALNLPDTLDPQLKLSSSYPSLGSGLLVSSNHVSCYNTFDDVTRTFSMHGSRQIPRIPPETRVVNILDSTFMLIEKDTFSNLLHCTEIRIINNKITAIQSGTFNGIPSLSTLELRSNTITVIKSGAFIGSRQLKLLKLTGNTVTSIQTHAFTWSTNCTQIIKNKNVWLNKNPAAFKGPSSIGSRGQ